MDTTEVRNWSCVLFWQGEWMCLTLLLRGAVTIGSTQVDEWRYITLVWGPLHWFEGIYKCVIWEHGRTPNIMPKECPSPYPSMLRNVCKAVSLDEKNVRLDLRHDMWEEAWGAPSAEQQWEGGEGRGWAQGPAPARSCKTFRPTRKTSGALFRQKTNI